MNTKDGEFQQWSPWEVLRDDIDSYLSKRSEPVSIGSSAVMSIVTLAIAPGAFKSAEAVPMVKEFADFYEQYPDLTLGLMGEIREKWNKPTHSAIVKKFFGMSPSCVLDGKKRQINDLTDQEAERAIKAVFNVSVSADTVKKTRQAMIRSYRSGLRIKVKPEIVEARFLLMAKGFKV